MPPRPHLQELLDVLQRRLVLLAEQRFRDEELLQQVGSELLSLQSSELRMVGLVEELHSEAQRRASLSENLRSELRRWEGGRTRLDQVTFDSIRMQYMYLILFFFFFF